MAPASDGRRWPATPRGPGGHAARTGARWGVALAAGVTLAGCAGSDGFDVDMRDRLGARFDTSTAALNSIAIRPTPDSRGVLSYPGYQVALSRRGDTVVDVASRVGVPVEELARHNGLPPALSLRAGEVLALPRRVAEPAPPAGSVTGPVRTAAIGGGRVVTAALDPPPVAPAPPAAAIAAPVGAAPAAEASRPRPSASGLPAGPEPIRHKVAAGETAFTIARLYDVPPRALGDWNGLAPDLAVREGQFLLIPVVVEQAGGDGGTAPGTGTLAPAPPSAAAPLPREEALAGPAAATPPSPDLAAGATAPATGGRLAPPVVGSIIRPFAKGRNEGIDIAAAAGAPVSAAGDGTVAAITRDTDQVPILVLRHPGNLLTVYAGVDQIAVARGDSVTRGQQIAVVREGSPAAIHFEVREGFDSVDPVDYFE